MEEVTDVVGECISREDDGPAVAFSAAVGWRGGWGAGMRKFSVARSASISDFLRRLRSVWRILTRMLYSASS